MISRRSILTLLGLAPVAALAAKLPVETERWLWRVSGRHMTLPACDPGPPIFIWNCGSEPLKVYGPSSAIIVGRDEQWQFEPTAQGWEATEVG